MDAYEERYFLVRCCGQEFDFSRWTPLERKILVDRHWWSRDALRQTKDIVFPENLADLLDRIAP